MTIESVVEQITLPSAELTQACRAEAADALAETQRRHSDKGYHNVRHIGRTIVHSLKLAQDIGEPEHHQASLVFAAANHDIVFVIGQRGTNERLSAEYAVERARRSGIFAGKGKALDRISNLVLATQTDFIDGQLVQHPNTWLEKAMCDGDLIDLRSELEEFKQSAQGNYEELCGRYPSWEMDAEFVAIEAEILAKTQPWLPRTSLLYPYQLHNLAYTQSLLHSEAA